MHLVGFIIRIAWEMSMALVQGGSVLRASLLPHRKLDLGVAFRRRKHDQKIIAPTVKNLPFSGSPYKRIVIIT